jgi:hypothetical protein
MGRNRPARSKSQWAELRQATLWFMAENMARGVPRDEAMEHWEDLSIAARIRRWKQACQTPHSQAQDPNTIASDLVEDDKLRSAVSAYEAGVMRTGAMIQ